MKKIINGQYVEITEEELALMKAEAEKHKDEMPPVSEITVEGVTWESMADAIMEGVNDV